MLTVVAGCGSSGSEDNPRPQGSPDVVLITVSGHVGVLSATNCTSADNRSYLGDAGEAAEAIATTLGNLGFSGLIGNYADIFAGVDADNDGITDDPEARGFLELLVLLQNLYDNWISGFDNPTSIIIVAHGHGAVWAHMAISVMSHVPIELLVTLDGICDLWECEHQAEVAAWLAANGDPYPWDISRPCGLWPVNGQPNDFDTSDVVFSNVRYALEVQSNDNETRDEIDNYRLDGTRTNIATFFSANEDHHDVRLVGSDALTWVDQRIRTIVLTGDL
ncbi:MAG: hypothetical protein ACYTGI_14360 [Planctomycetota bacterium]